MKDTSVGKNKEKWKMFYAKKLWNIVEEVELFGAFHKLQIWMTASR